MPKIRIAAGSIELEYEGSQELSTNDMKELLAQVCSLTSTVPASATGAAATMPPDGDKPIAGQTLPKMHTNTVAQKLQASTGPDLALAAACHLQVILSKDSFSRTDLLEDMKSATSYYKQNMSGNLSKILDTLVTNGKLNQVGQNIYSISATEKTALEARIAP